MSSIQFRPLLTVALAGAIVVGLTVGAFKLVGVFSDLGEQRSDLAMKLDRLRERPVDIALLVNEQSLLMSDTLASRGMFGESERAAAEGNFLRVLNDLTEQATGAPAEIGRIESIERGEFLELATRIEHTLDRATIDELISALRESRPVLFVDKLELKRVIRADGNHSTLNITGVLRAYADLSAREPEQ